MRILFVYDQVERSTIIGKHLFRRGHEVEYINDAVSVKASDVLVLDHPTIKHQHKYLVSLDRDLGLSISPFICSDAKHRGPDYIVIPNQSGYDKYDPSKKSKDILVDIEDMDILKSVLDTINKMGYNAVVKYVKGCDVLGDYKNIAFFDPDSLYNAARDCIIGVMDGGMYFYSMLYYGMPVVALGTNDDKRKGIDYLHHCCLPCKSVNEVEDRSGWLLDSEYYRRNISDIARFYVDGKGASRVAALIEGIYG